MKLILFDVDGTLTVPRNKINQTMLNTLSKLKEIKDINIGFVGGSDLKKQQEQLGIDNFNLFDWRFSENGVLAFQGSECIHSASFVDQLGENHFKQFINICLLVIAQADCPVKRGTFIEFRRGMLNISPIGRACSQEERDQFEIYDQQHQIRSMMIKQITQKWDLYLEENHLQYLLPKIKFAVGGQISIDIFPEGWDKTYCLQFIEDKYDQIYFFGDKTDLGGNDYEIYIDKRVTGFKVENYQHTIQLLQDKFLN